MTILILLRYTCNSISNLNKSVNVANFRYFEKTRIDKFLLWLRTNLYLTGDSFNFQIIPNKTAVISKFSLFSVATHTRKTGSLDEHFSRQGKQMQLV